ncbi:MAG: serine acetyltransferase [Bacteroidota bacterium]
MDNKLINLKPILESFSQELRKQHDHPLVDIELKRQTQFFVENLLGILFPHFRKEGYSTTEEISSRLVLLERDLKQLLTPLVHGVNANIEEIANRFIAVLPDIYKKLWLDGDAITSGDPAAESVDEVILAYPGFLAIAIYRFAHEFYSMHVPIFPRLLTEYAHEKTGIDIHPGAQIGLSFAIDHGTGIVIGESTIIGENVKIYQGVTLGALSVAKDMAKSKRHPTIEDNVVIYAQSVILGGETIVGRHSVIGGNVWLTHSVAPYSIVYQEQKTIVQNRDERDGIINFFI